jgi:tetratricopeptide (TPR) repeat protein
MSTGLSPEPEGHSQPKLGRVSNWVAGPFFLSLVIAIAVVVIYFPVHHHPFFSVDDAIYIDHNAHVQSGLNWNTLKWASTSRLGGEWHPLTWLSHALDCQIFGSDPAGHHVMNVLFHALNAVLLFWVLRRATDATGRSFVVAALFAVHPINVEPVAWVAERKTLLSMVFFLLALDAYRCYTRKPQESRYWIVAVLFSLGLLCKPQVIMLPFVLLLWDYWPLGRMFQVAEHYPDGTHSSTFEGKYFFALVKDKAFLFALAAVDALFTMTAARGGAHPGHVHYGLPVRIENAVVSYALYIGRAFWPFDLAPDYPYPGNSLSAWKIVAALAFLVAISTLVAANWRRRYLLVGWLWFLITLTPLIGVVQGPMFTADRYAYISFVGLFIMISWGVADLLLNRALTAQTSAPIGNFDSARSWRTGVSGLQCRRSICLLAAVSATVLLGLAVIAHHQVGYWEDEVTLWSHTLQVTTDNWFAESRIGVALAIQGKPTESNPHFSRALALNPDDPVANVNVAFWEHDHGNLPAAIEHYKKALSSAKNDDAEIKIRAATNLGYAYRALGDAANAQAYFARAADERKQQERQ